MASKKEFSITKNRRGKNTIITGTTEYLIDYFKYTLEAGKTWEHESGNKKINTNPRGIKSLVKNLNNAVNNSAANGYSETSFSITQ